jgi:hypothetical protein
MAPTPDVAPAGSFELELGALGLLRDGRNRSLISPAVVNYFGVGNDSELVVEGRLAHRFGAADGARTSLDYTAVSVKRVLRKGSLQEGGSGVSVAMECSVLLPSCTKARRGGPARSCSDWSSSTASWCASMPVRAGAAVEVERFPNCAPVSHGPCRTESGRPVSSPYRK